MHVARLRISGVRGFYGARSVDLDLTRPYGSLVGWTILADRNGAGNSTVLQSLALALAGPQATSFIPSIADWMSRGAETAQISVDLSLSDFDGHEAVLLPPGVGITFDQSAPQREPSIRGDGIDAWASGEGWFYAGYGPFRHLSGGGNLRPGKARLSKVAQQVSSLFDEAVPLTDAVDWLIEQHLYELEGRENGARLLQVAMTLLDDGLLPDGFQVSKVDSDGLWVTRDDMSSPLREMSDGYRAVTGLVTDIIRQIAAVYPALQLEYRKQTPTLPYPGVVLIDEVEDHLHISWQKVIGTWLETHFPQIQFIVTTHSPYICQSADPGGLIRLPSPGENNPPRIIEQDLYERIIYGSGDDAILTELFGVDTPYSVEAERLRQRLGDLEVKILDGVASADEKEEFRTLTGRLHSS